MDFAKNRTQQKRFWQVPVKEIMQQHLLYGYLMASTFISVHIPSENVQKSELRACARGADLRRRLASRLARGEPLP